MFSLGGWKKDAVILRVQRWRESVTDNIWRRWWRYGVIAFQFCGKWLWVDFFLICSLVFSKIINSIAWPWQDNHSSTMLLLAFLFTARRARSEWMIKTCTKAALERNFQIPQVTKVRVKNRQTWNADYIFSELWKDQFIFCETWSCY